MKGYIEKVEINDDQSARFVVFIPKLIGSQYAVLRAVWQSCALTVISFRPTRPAPDEKRDAVKSDSESKPAVFRG